jgi:hypothetical protein
MKMKMIKIIGLLAGGLALPASSHPGHAGTVGGYQWRGGFVSIYRPPVFAEIPNAGFVKAPRVTVRVGPNNHVTN